MVALGGSEGVMTKSSEKMWPVMSECVWLVIEVSVVILFCSVYITTGYHAKSGRGMLALEGYPDHVASTSLHLRT